MGALAQETDELETFQVDILFRFSVSMIVLGDLVWVGRVLLCVIFLISRILSLLVNNAILQLLILNQQSLLVLNLMVASEVVLVDIA